MKEREGERLPWDKKKIALLLLFLLGLLLVFFTAKSIFLDEPPTDSSSAKTVRGVKVEGPKDNNFSSGSGDSGVSVNLEEKVEDIKSEIDNINVAEVASSSPQIQKILQDIKSLKDYPSSAARQTCENICKNL